MAEINLSSRDIDLIGRVVATEVPGFLAYTNPQEYDRMVGAVVDTVLNRVETGRYGKTVEDVLNDDRAFSKITGPERLNPYGTITAAPKAPEQVQNVVNSHLTDRAQGKPSTIPGALDYANPNYSDRKNLLDWVNPMIEAGAQRFGVGKAVHYHGVAPGNRPAGTVTPNVPEDFFPGVDPSVRSWSPEDVVPTLNPSPVRPDEFDFEGPKGNFSVPAQFAAPVSPVERGGPLAPAFTGAIAPLGVDVPSLTPAPAGEVTRGASLPDLSQIDYENVTPGTGDFLPSATAMDRAAVGYGQLADTMGQAGVRGIGAMPTAPMSLPDFAPAPSTAPAAAPVSNPVSQFANLPDFAPVPTAAPRASEALMAPAVMPSLAPPVASVPGASINPMKGSEPGRHNKAGFGDFAKGAVKGGMAAGLPGAVAGGVIGGLRGSRVENPGPGKTGPLGLGLLGTNRGGPLGLGILPGLASLFGGGSGGLGGLGGLIDFSGGGWASSPGYGGTFSSPGDGGGFSTRGDSGWDAPGYR